MELNMKADYSVLYDGAPQMKAVSVDKKKLDEKAKKVFLANIIKSKKLSRYSKRLKMIFQVPFFKYNQRNFKRKI